MLNVRSLAFAVALGLGPTACSQSASQIAVAGNAQIKAEVSPGVSGEPNAIRLHSVSGAPASVTIDMPGMAMRPEQYALQNNGGAYQASDVRFSMAGAWRIQIYDASHAPLGTFTVTVR